MIPVSNEFKKQVANDNRNYLTYADITLADSTVLNLTNTDIWMGGFGGEDAVSSSGKFDLGGAISNSFFVVLNNIYDDFSVYDFNGATVVPWIGLEIDGEVEKFRKGEFTVIDPQYNGATIKLNCCDNMHKFDKGYEASILEYPAALGDIVQDACEVCGVTLNTYEFPHKDFVVATKPTPETTTFRSIISWCAQIAGCFARCNRYGQLELKWFDQSLIESIIDANGGTFNPWDTGDAIDGGTFNPWSDGDTADAGSFSDYDGVHFISSTQSTSIATDDVVITGVRVVEKNDADSDVALTTYQSGTDGYVIAIEENALIQGGAGLEIAGWLGEQLIGFRFRPCTVSHLSDPTMEAGDVAFLIDRKGNAYEILVSVTRFTAGSSQSTECSAETPAKNSSERYSNNTKNYVEYRNLIKKEKTAREKALEELGNRLATSPGLYTTQEETDSGNIYYMHNKPTLEDSDIIWKMTAEAWGVSSDGGETWNGGMTVDGDTIARILTATGINADWIKTGSIVAKDADGNVVFSVNVATGEVKMSASATIEETTLEEYVQGVADASAGEVQDNVDSLAKRVTTAETNITANAKEIALKAAQTTVDTLSGQVTEAEAAIQVNATAITSKVSKGDVSSQISQEAGKVSIKGNRLIIEADNFELDEDGNVSVSGKYTAKFVRRYDSTSFTEEEVTRARKIAAGYVYDDLTQEELDRYDLFGDGFKLNEALLMNRFLNGYYDWYDITTEISIDPTGYSPCFKAVTYVQYSQDGVESEMTIKGETKISGSGLNAPEITADSYNTSQTVDGENVEYAGTSGTFTSADGKTIEVVNGLIVAIY